LPSDDADLETPYTSGDETDVASDNSIRVGQSASGQYAIHQFKDFIGNWNKVTLTCDVQTDLLPSLSTVYLQIYNRTTPVWETVDSDNFSPINEDFLLSADINDTSEYVSEQGIVSCRVYQQMT